MGLRIFCRTVSITIVLLMPSTSTYPPPGVRPLSLAIRPGDIIFTRQADPALVKEREPTTGVLRLDRDKDAVKEIARHGYINGIDPDKRQEFLAILDEVKGATEDPAQRIDLLKNRIELLEQDPKNSNLSRYLRSEMAHLMNVFGVKPREFSIDSFKLR
jgi:hypothetical protein